MSLLPYSAPHRGWTPGVAWSWIGRYASPGHMEPSGARCSWGSQPASPVAPLVPLRSGLAAWSLRYAPAQTALSWDFHLWPRGCSISPDLQERGHMAYGDARTMNPADRADGKPPLIGIPVGRTRRHMGRVITVEWRRGSSRDALARD